MNRSAWVVIIIIVLLALGFLIYAMSNPDAEPSEMATTTGSVPAASDTTTPPSGGTNSPASVTVTYDGDSFSPANLTISPGTTVTWVNNTGERMWIASDDHPTHTRYDGTSTSEHCANGTATNASVFDQCGAGTRYSFTFTKTGAWEYHNHGNSSAGGTVTVR